jgi:hypothetical protein
MLAALCRPCRILADAWMLGDADGPDPEEGLLGWVRTYD